MAINPMASFLFIEEESESGLTKIQCVSIISEVRRRRKEPGGGGQEAAGAESGGNGAGVQLTVVAIG